VVKFNEIHSKYREAPTYTGCQPIKIQDTYIRCWYIKYTFSVSLRGIKEEFEDTKGIIRIRKSKKNRQHNGKRTKGQTTIYKTLHRKPKIE